MQHVRTSISTGIAEVVLCRGKVNALDDPVVAELGDCFRALAADPEVTAAVLSGHGKFFSFGFDIPEFLGWSKESFIGYLTRFTDLYRDLFAFPKPLVAALNGHTIAGGCMLALACDLRLMVPGTAKISLNEITFGASVFAGAVEMLRVAVGERNARDILYGGAMYDAGEAHALGLVDQVVAPEGLAAAARSEARRLGERDGAAFASVKAQLRGPASRAMLAHEKASVLEFADIWYSPATRRQLERITIR